MKPRLIARPLTGDDRKRLADFIGSRGDEDILRGVSFAFHDDIPPTPDSPTLRPPPDFNDLLLKAHAGDADALRRYARYTRSLCHQLELLSARCPTLAKEVASGFSDWPINVSLSGSRVGELGGAVRELLERLDVGGDKAPLPAYPTQRSDPKNIWTQYALNAHRCLLNNKALVPHLLELSKRATRKFHSPLREFKTDHWATWYEVEGKIVLIVEWQVQCIDLPERMTKDNVCQFMEVATLAIREFWLNEPEHYRRLRATLGNSRYQTDGQIIDAALKSISQALEGIAHK
jgi:hypothetical protein